MTDPLSPPPASPAPAVRRPNRLLWGCGGVIALLLLVIAVLLFMLWWSQRPITPVKLSVPEREMVDAKLRYLGSPQAERERTEAAPTHTDAQVPELDRPYEAGGKTVRLTEREVNGLLNDNTDLGERVKIEFGRDAINAYVAVRLPDDFPIGGGQTLRLKGRVRVSVGEGQPPMAVLEDLTVFGVSLPQAWLPMKGKNLFEDLPAQGGHQPGKLLQGIKSLRVEPGSLVLEVKD